MKKWLLAVIAVSILALAACSNDSASYDTVDIDEVEIKMDEGFIVLDVRSRAYSSSAKQTVICITAR